MTALNFLLEKDRVCVTMDTLVSAADDRRPSFFATKIFLLPHLNSALCATGTLNFILDWFVFVESSVLGHDVRVLAEFGEERLPGLWSPYVSQSPSLSATVYHFGWDTIGERFRGFRHDSDTSFRCDEITYGAYMKPEVIDPPELVTLPDSFIELMHRQRANDAALPASERLGIGGEVHFLVMTRRSATIEVSHRFEDFEAAFATMMTQLTETNA